MDYFEHFGIPRKYHIDLVQLRKKYYEMSRAIHPDHMPLMTQNNSATADISFHNLAYKTLSEPLSRLKYILNLEGVDTSKDLMLTQDFLMEMMDLHEEIDRLKENNEATFQKNIDLKIEQLELNILSQSEYILKEYDTGQRSPSIIEQMLEFFVRLKYVDRLKMNRMDKTEF